MACLLESSLPGLKKKKKARNKREENSGALFFKATCQVIRFKKKKKGTENTKIDLKRLFSSFPFCFFFSLFFSHHSVYACSLSSASWGSVCCVTYALGFLWQPKGLSTSQKGSLYNPDYYRLSGKGIKEFPSNSFN